MIEGLLVQVSLPVESLCFVLEQDILSAAYYWFNQGKTRPDMTDKLLLNGM